MYGPRFVSALIVQTSSRPRALNTITATLKPNFHATQATKIVIEGLKGSSQAYGDVAVRGGGEGTYTPKLVNGNALWKTGGILEMKLDTSLG